MKAVVVIAFYVWLALTVAIVLGRLARWATARAASRRRRRARLAARAVDANSIATTATPPSNPPISITAPSLGNSSLGTPALADPVTGAARASGLTESPQEGPSPNVSGPVEKAPSELLQPAALPERRRIERRRGDRRHADRRESAPPAETAAQTPVSAASAPGPQPIAHRPTIAHLLAGFALPSGMTPITPAGTDPNDQTASLISRARDAYDVGTSIADELERLGFALQPMGDTQLLASRNGEQLSVMIDPDPHDTDAHGGRRFPTANPGDVVVEFWVGSSTRPN